MPLPQPVLLAATDAAALVARILLAAIFIHDGWGKITGYAGAAAYAQSFGLPASTIPVAIAIELGCGLAIVAGYHTRFAALVLAGFCLATALVFHTKLAQTNQLLHFEKNLAIAGGFVALWALGAGRWSLDRLWRRDRETESA